MNILFLLRLLAKRFWCSIGLGSTLIEFCLDCGARQPVYWWSDDALWSEVTGEVPVAGDNMAGVLCPRCFADRAAAKGKMLKWTPTVVCE
jgi:hypothetical protein